MYKSPSFNQPKYDHHLVGTQMIRQDLIENEVFDRQMVHMDHNKTGPLGSDLPKAEWCLATAALAGSAVPAVSGAHTLVWTNTPAMHTEGCHTLAQSHCNLDKHTCNAHRRVSHPCTVTLQFGQTHLQCTQKGVTHMHSCILVWTNTPAMHTEGCHTHAQLHSGLDKHTCNAHRRVSHTCSHFSPLFLHDIDHWQGQWPVIMKVLFSIF